MRQQVKSSSSGSNLKTGLRKPFVCTHDKCFNSVNRRIGLKIDRYHQANALSERQTA
jgi:hypothetical protein